MTLLTMLDPPQFPLVLNWIFTEPIPGSGGHATTIRIMNLLASFGHQVNIYVVPYKRLLDKSDLEIRDFVRRHFADLEGQVFKWTGGPMAKSDAVILTYWDTAYMLDDAHSTSRVFYFVQDWEPFFYPMGVQYLRAEQTYKMGFSCITLGPWLTQYLRQRYHADADYFDLAVDHKIYYPRPVGKLTRPRICFYARPSTPRRLFPLGVAALNLVYQRRPDVEIMFYGAADADLAKQSISFPYTNRGILMEDELAELFSASDIGLVLSPTNCSLVSPEMMACQCAVVDLNRETVRGVLEHEVNALLTEPMPDTIAHAILRLLDDDPLRQRLVATAYRQVQERSWEKSSRQVEAILYKKLSPSQQTSQEIMDSRPNALATADLPREQQEQLDAIHATRRATQLQARLMRGVKRLAQTDYRVVLNHKLISPMSELTGQNHVGQTFVARLDNLHRIDVLVTPYDRRNTRDIVFHLRESPSSSDDLATVRVNASLLPDNSYCSFVFEPQAGSRHKSFYFDLDSPESVPGDAIALWAYSDVNLPDAKLYRSGHAINGQLVFGVYYLNGQWGEVGERPLLSNWARATTAWDRLSKAYRLLASQGPSGLVREIRNYLHWETSH